MDESAFFKRLFRWIKKGVKKVGSGIKKVAGVAKKVAPIALLAAASFFTFGAALGITAGWGTIVSGAMSKVGLSGTLANVVGGFPGGVGNWG